MISPIKAKAYFYDVPDKIFNVSMDTMNLFDNYKLKQTALVPPYKVPAGSIHFYNADYSASIPFLLDYSQKYDFHYDIFKVRILYLDLNENIDFHRYKQVFRRLYDCSGSAYRVDLHLEKLDFLKRESQSFILIKHNVQCERIKEA